MINLESITKNYGEKNIYKDFNLSIEDGKTTVILGESGSGKTTLLNIISGQTEYSGRIEGEIKPISYIFQTDRLVKNLNVEDNLKLVLGESADIDGILESVGLLESKRLYIKSLSAGMARRVAIARAFYYPSKVLLMDEPFTNLDIALKYSLIDLVKKLNEKEKKTIIMVTHDIKEAIFLADRVVVLKSGKVIFDEKSINKKTEDEIFNLLVNQK